MRLKLASITLCVNRQAYVTSTLSDIRGQDPALPNTVSTLELVPVSNNSDTYHFDRTRHQKWTHDCNEASSNVISKEL